ncbi:putative signal peptide and transmembrane domain containing protein [Cryptosporidium canis]|uniref:Signal peptide and transmembrane domain containing protein n=1 Tax=Cryptosporidium canis TaxID=195482 RepID=A0ABQ8PCP0_9CRYT|nr:putative signal peptide and transmembrane domain containing protein [Cryptosporidium canis]KAJ1614561.1 putative signal peptide and transmembrane domain containing protein [Cryptosporidium canis]
MKNLLARNYALLSLFVYSLLVVVNHSRGELFIINNKTNNHTTDSWFNLGLLKEFLADENVTTSSVDVFDGFKKMIRISPPTPQEKSASWVPQNIKDVISRINYNSKKEEIKSKHILKRKFDDLKHYLEYHLYPTENSRNKTNSEDKGWSFPSFGFAGKNSTNDQSNKRTISQIPENLSSEKSSIDHGSEGNSQNSESLKETIHQDTRANSSSVMLIDQCEKNVIHIFKDCIERCKNNLKQAQYRSGGISPLIISELNTCIHNCRNSANSSNCKLSASSINLINEEIPIPKPTIRRNQKNQERSRGLLNKYIIDPIVSFITTLLFCILGIVVILYYFKEHRIYPRTADYITYKIESYYTEDEKRRAIFEGDGFPQQPKLNWKRTIVYFIRLNFLPRFLANNFTWLIPMRDHYQQTTDPSNYVRVH